MQSIGTNSVDFTYLVQQELNQCLLIYHRRGMLHMTAKWHFPTWEITSRAKQMSLLPMLKIFFFLQDYYFY